MSFPKSYSSLKLIKDCWILLGGYRIKFLFYSLLSIISGLMPFFIAYFLGQVVDFFINFQKGESLRLFYFYIAGIAIAGSMQIWLRFVAKWQIYYIASQLRMKVRVLALTRLADFDIKWHEEQESGSKIQKIYTGGDSIYAVFRFFLDSAIPITTGIMGGLFAVTFLSYKYVLYAIIYILVYFVFEYAFNKNITSLHDKVNEMKEKVSGKIHESASNILAVKTLGLKKSMEESINSYEKEFLDITLKSRKASQNKFRVIKILSAIVYAGFVLLLGLDTAYGLISVGSIVIFVGYFDRIKGAMDGITNSSSDFIETKSGVGRIMYLLDKKIIKRDSYPYKDISPNWDKIVFNKVNFKYKDKFILKDVNFEIKRGQKIGIVGKSGEGKSTIAKLLLGLYESGGQILIGGLNINKTKYSSINNNISVVMQDSEMFNVSLKENITMASSKEVDPVLLEKAIEFSCLKEVVNKLPKGLDTLIGEKGYKTSGGERQRIGLARAIYKNSDILILDEATSNLDSKTESQIQQNFKILLKNKTVIVIAHRLSTLKDMDKIFVLQEGKIKEEGDFSNLLNKKGFFYELYNIQKAK